MKAIQYRRALATGEGDARSRGLDLVKAGVVQGLAGCGVSWGRLLRQGRFSSRGLAGASAGIVAHPGLSSAAAPKRPLGRAGVAASESGVLACCSGSSAWHAIGASSRTAAVGHSSKLAAQSCSG